MGKEKERKKKEKGYFFFGFGFGFGGGWVRTGERGRCYVYMRSLEEEGGGRACPPRFFGGGGWRGGIFGCVLLFRFKITNIY